MVWTFRKKWEDANAKNWPGVIIMDPSAKPYGAIWAQECYEAELKLNPINLLALRFSRGERIDMEIMGHEIEVQAAVKFYDAEEEPYRRAEAQALTGYRDFQKRKLKAPRIYRDMELVSQEAKNWVKRNEKRIADHV